MNEYILAYTIGNDITGTVRISQEELHRSLQNLIREKVGNNAAVMQSLNTLAVQNGGNNDVRFLELAGDPNHGQDPQPQVAVVAVNQTVIDYTKFIRLCRIEAIDEINFQVREFQITTGEPFTGPGSVVEFFQQFTAREFQGLYLHDLVQFEIDHPALNTPFFIAPTSVGEFRIDDILDEIENVVASNTTFKIDNHVTINMTICLNSHVDAKMTRNP